MWSFAAIADGVEKGLSLQLSQLDCEQAVYGLDSLDEIELHPLLAEAIKAAEFGVYPEQRYPCDRFNRRQTLGRRCDLVLTPDGRELVQPEAEATLFAADDAVPLAEAMWLEVKTVAQFTVDGPNQHYSKELLSPVRQDVTKLAGDPSILHAAVLLILFTAERRVAEHDLDEWEKRCLRYDLPIAVPSIRHLPLTDRLGNGLCTIAVYPVRNAEY